MSKNKPEPQHIIWIPKEAASWGPDDPKISKPYLFAKEITKHLDCDEATIDEVDFLADRLLDKLQSALMYYQLITADDFSSRNISQKRTIYEGLYANLWSFYKGRVQNYLKEMGWNLSIFFCNDKNCEKEAIKFIEATPEHKDIVEMARVQRESWQSDFANSRNISEHSGDYRNGVNTYETKDDAHRLFAQVCWTAETLIAYFGSYKMKREWNIIELNPKSNIFIPEDRYIIEHAAQTARRPK
ncbi:MAG: hypothetical protein WAZ19_15390 [Anaerolineae bacterium]